MRRRKFLIGAGSIAAGSAAAMGSGAFAVENAQREGGGTVVADNVANLRLYPNGSDHSFISSNGELEVDLQDLNGDATTHLDDVFFMENQGTEAVDVSISASESIPDVSINTVPITTDGASNGSETGTDLLTNSANLAVGESWGIGVEITVGEQDGSNGSPPYSASGVTFTIDAN